MNVARIDHIDRLLRGISTGHVETVRDAWRALVTQGDAAVPIVLGKLASPAWSDNPRGPRHRYLGVLLALLDELDPGAFRTETERLLGASLHPVHRKTVEILAGRGADAPAAHVGPGIPVYVARDIEDHRQVLDNLARWSRTRGLALANVTRIDVIARHPGLDYLGLYNLFFSGIILTWPTNRVRGPALWWRRIDAEFTFYHEVGHHACGHTEGGSVAEQEKEADDYARKIFRRAHPVPAGVARAILFPLKPLLRALVANATKTRPGAAGSSTKDD